MSEHMVNKTQPRQIRITIADSDGNQWTLPIVSTYKEAVDAMAEACRSGYRVVMIERNF